MRLRNTIFSHTFVADSLTLLSEILSHFSQRISVFLIEGVRGEALRVLKPGEGRKSPAKAPTVILCLFCYLAMTKPMWIEIFVLFSIMAMIKPTWIEHRLEIKFVLVFNYGYDKTMWIEQPLS